MRCCVVALVELLKLQKITSIGEHGDAHKRGQEEHISRMCSGTPAAGETNHEARWSLASLYAKIWTCITRWRTDMTTSLDEGSAEVQSGDNVVFTGMTD